MVWMIIEIYKKDIEHNQFPASIKPDTIQPNQHTLIIPFDQNNPHSALESARCSWTKMEIWPCWNKQHLWREKTWVRMCILPSENFRWIWQSSSILISSIAKFILQNSHCEWSFELTEIAVLVHNDDRCLVLWVSRIRLPERQFGGLRWGLAHLQVMDGQSCRSIPHDHIAIACTGCRSEFVIRVAATARDRCITNSSVGEDRRCES